MSRVILNFFYKGLRRKYQKCEIHLETISAVKLGQINVSAFVYQNLAQATSDRPHAEAKLIVSYLEGYKVEVEVATEFSSY